MGPVGALKWVPNLVEIVSTGEVKCHSRVHTARGMYLGRCSADCWSGGDLYIVRGGEHCGVNVMEHASLDVDETKALFHALRHALREVGQLFSDILLECLSAPVAHFLNVSV